MNELMLPDGEHTIGEKIYIVKDGKVLEIKDVEKQEVVAEVTPEETPKEEEVKAEEVIEEVVAEDKPKSDTQMAIDETELMTILQPKLEEIYKMIADLNAKLEGKEDVEEIVETPVAMNIHQKFSNVMNFIKEK